VIIYPYTTSDLVNTGNVPSDGKYVRAIHFNRLFSEISALQSALGPGERLYGSTASLDARLDGEMNEDGTLERELLTDSDESGNKLGSTRYWDSQKADTQLSIPGSTAGQTEFIRLAYSAWDEPPAFFCCWGDDDNIWELNAARDLINGVSEVGVQVAFRKFNGGSIDATIDGEVHWLAVSRNRRTWQGGRAWALPPVRTGS